MADILLTGVSALKAFQRALAVTSHNIANVNTPSYSRQRVELTNNLPQLGGGGYIGTGVNVQSITRVYDDFLTQQIRGHSSNVGQSETMDRWITQLDNLMGDGNTGLSPALKQFFAAAQDVANSPASLSARQALLGQAQTLASQFQALDGQMNTLREGVNQSLSNTVGTINTLAENIAKANQAIALSQGSTGAAASDLLDQRDKLVADLAQKVPVNTVTQPDGTLSVFIGNGQTLVLGNRVNTLETTRSTADPRKLDIRFKGNPSAITESLSGGEVGGYLAFQSQVLDPAQNKLGLMAAGLAETFNAQHKLGMDLNGKLGGDFFNTGSPQVISNAENTSGSSSAPTVTIDDISKIQPSDYDLKYDGTSTPPYSLIRLSDNQKITLGGSSPSYTADGMKITVKTTSSPDAGDRFLIQPTRQAAISFGVKIKDANLFAAAAPIKTAASQSNTGTGKISAGEVPINQSPPPTNPPLLNPVSINFTSATQYTINGGLPTPYTSGANIDFNGWRVQITGTPGTGDIFQVASNAGGVGDNRNGLKLAGLQTGKTLLNGASTYQDVQSQMVSEVGTQGSSTRNTLKTQEALQGQAVQARDSVSGVNLDEEAANLMKYQQSYEAAAKVIQVGDAIIQTLLNAIGR